MLLRPSGSLTTSNFERALTNDDMDDVVIDLRSASFIDPYALVSIVSIARAASNTGHPVRFFSPQESHVANYLARMDVDRMLSEHASLDVALPAVRHNPAGTVLVPVTWFESGARLEPLDAVLFARLDNVAPPWVIQALSIAVFELADNVRYHANTRGGVLAAQVLERGTDSERVHFALADAGIGIRKSLQLAGISTADDRAAIESALTEGVSATNQVGRGVGLPTTKEEVMGLRGSMVVRSGRGRLTYQPSGVTRTSHARVTGTTVGISIPCGR